MPSSTSVTRPDIVEQRRSHRLTLLIRAAKLIASAGEYLCIVRDASQHGVSIKTFCPLPPDPVMILELLHGGRYPIEKVWERDGNAGFKFREPADLDALLAEGSGESRRRHIRLNYSASANLHSQGASEPVVFRDISQQGACIECHKRLAIAERVRIECSQLPAIIATVRWRREPYYGLIFEQTFRFDELARLTAPAQVGDMSEALRSTAAAPVSRQLG